MKSITVLLFLIAFYASASVQAQTTHKSASKTVENPGGNASTGKVISDVTINNRIRTVTYDTTGIVPIKYGPAIINQGGHSAQREILTK